MKRIELASLDRRVLLGAGLSLMSIALIAIAVGLFVVVSALTDDPVQLPSEGTIEEILQDNEGSEAAGEGSGGTAGILPPGVPAPPQGPPPTRMAIPAISIDAPVAAMNFESGTNIPAVPNRADLVAWYDFTAAPALGNNAVFTGHVDWQTRSGAPIPGVFYRLRELRMGDEITLTLDDGKIVQYRVTGNVATNYDDPNVVKSMNQTSKDVITLITCGGSWVNDPSKDNGGNYTHRIVVRAERVTESAAALSAD